MTDERINLAELRRYFDALPDGSRGHSQRLSERQVLALVEAVTVQDAIDRHTADLNPDFDALSLLFTRKRMAFARLDFGEPA